MALHLSSRKPRQLHYHHTGLKDDYMLLEVDDAILQDIKTSGVIIKGAQNEEAVICSKSRTYALKYVETSNLLLLVPPDEEGDEEFDGIPSLTPGGTSTQDVHTHKDTGLQTQLRKVERAGQYAPIMVQASAKAHIEMVQCAPRVETLPLLLGERLYNENDEEPGPTDMDADAGSSTSNHDAWGGTGLYTFEELLERVQASPAELQAALAEQRAVQVGRHWRLVEEGYLGGLLELLLLSATEAGWPLDCIPLQEAVEALQPSGYQPCIIRHCLAVHGQPAAVQNSAEAAAPSPMASDAQPGTDAGQPSATQYALNAKEVCLHFARKLLRQQRLWALADFLPAWAAACPPELPPSQDMLRGEALVEGAASSSAGGSSRRGSEDGAAGVAKVRHFPASALPRDPAARFAALFAARGRWVRADLEPYLAGMCVPGCTAESLLLKYARASQRTPAEPMEFSARG